MNTITFLTTPARRCLAAVVLLFVGLLPTLATSTYYYKVKVEIDPSTTTAIGKVYINGEETTSIQGDGSGIGASAIQPTIAVQPINGSGYQFDHWSWRSWDGSNQEDYNISINPYLVFDSETKITPTTYTFLAHFKEVTGDVRAEVASGQSNRGTARVSPLNNTDGVEVTLTANADVINGCRFLGWTKDDGNDYKSTSATYTFTVDDSNKGTYYAHFSEPQTQIYCRIKNKSGKYLMLYGNSPASKHKRTYSSYNGIEDGFIFTNSLKLVSKDEAMGNPMTVFLRTGESSGQGSAHVSNLSSCGVYYTTLVNSQNYPLTMQVTSSGIRIYTTYNCSISGEELPLNCYLRDDGSGWAVMQTIADLNINEGLDWEVILLNEDTEEGSFGAFAKEKYKKEYENGTFKYYTTMYTEFPYKVMDGVKAYYLPASKDSYNETTNTVHFQEIQSGKVPSKTAVVLECQEPYNNDATNNRLLPITETLQNVTNFLKGYTSLNGEKPDGTKNDNNKFILSIVGNKLGWYYSTATYMTPNKAFIDISVIRDWIENHPNEARTVKFVFGNDIDEETTGIIAPEYADEVEGPLFDLNGRRVTNGDAYGLKKGIYITNGKKIVVK